MPMSVKPLTGGGELYVNPFVGPINHPVSIRVAVAALSADVVDQHGYLKAGVPLTRAGALPGVAPAFVFGCVIEATKVHTDNTTLGTAAPVDVTVAVIGTINRALLEDNLGRALTADELAAFDRAGSKIALLY